LSVESSDDDAVMGGKIEGTNFLEKDSKNAGGVRKIDVLIPVKPYSR